MINPWDEYDTEVIKKIELGLKLSRDELKYLAMDCEYVSEVLDTGRWAEKVRTIAKVHDRFFALEWERGLTECQENEFWNQPCEVKPHKYEKMVTITEWIPVKNE